MAFKVSIGKMYQNLNYFKVIMKLCIWFLKIANAKIKRGELFPQIRQWFEENKISYQFSEKILIKC